VMDSRGSVIPLFRSQIEKGQPITVTDPEMTRFMMSLEKAVDLILLSGQRSEGGEIFILKMSSVKIMDLAEVLLDAFGGIKDASKAVTIVGKRPGEKRHERLMTSDEAERAEEEEYLFILNRAIGKGVHPESYYSELTRRLSKSQIKSMLKEAGAL
jgi:UDP-N-acetylglucosamine 4,6-dehydratase/5-epimerase